MTTKEHTQTRADLLEQEKATLLRVNQLLEQIIETQGMALQAMRQAHPSYRGALADVIEFGGAK